MMGRWNRYYYVDLSIKNYYCCCCYFVMKSSDATFYVTHQFFIHSSWSQHYHDHDRNFMNPHFLTFPHSCTRSSYNATFISPYFNLLLVERCLSTYLSDCSPTSAHSRYQTTTRTLLIFIALISLKIST